jgi:membrane protein implicated in regulation of membrane protease activity
MIWLYIASAVFGGTFVVPMALGGLDFEADVGELDMDVGDVGDLGDAGELDMDVGTGLTGAVGDFVASLLSFRSIVMACTFFGLSGIVFTVLDTNVVLALLTSIVLGFVAASANAGLTKFVLNRQQSSHVTLREMHGVSAEVMLPIADDRRGQVRAQIAGQTEYFTALPFKPGVTFEPGDTVVVVEIQDGMARVVSLGELGRLGQ